MNTQGLDQFVLIKFNIAFKLVETKDLKREFFTAAKRLDAAEKQETLFSVVRVALNYTHSPVKLLC
jgi:hypothetical protein